MGSRTIPSRRPCTSTRQLGLVDDMLHYFDRTSMAHSLEVRVPFLDHKVVEFCATIPAGLKVRRLTTKHVLKRAAPGLVPDRVIDKPKIGFFKPARGRLVPLAGRWRDRRLPARPGPALRRVPRSRPRWDGWSGPYLEGGGGARTLLSILMLEVWLSTYVPRALGAPPGSGSRPRARVTGAPSYVCLTPARDEAANLPRLAASLAAQTAAAAAVDRDRQRLARRHRRGRARARARHPWIALLERGGRPVAGARRADREGPARRHRGHRGPAGRGRQPRRRRLVRPRLLRAAARPLRGRPGARHHERHLLRARERRVAPAPRHRHHRVGRLARLALGVPAAGAPLEERLGWDGIDEFKANARGWSTRTQLDLPFHHHRPEGSRDGGMHRARITQGRTAHYMGYRPWYLATRSLWLALRDPSALALIWGYAGAALRGEPRCADPAVRAYVRSQQSPRNLPARAREARGRRGAPSSAPRGS